MAGFGQGSPGIGELPIVVKAAFGKDGRAWRTDEVEAVADWVVEHLVPGMLGAAYLYTGDDDAAQEIVQEFMCTLNKTLWFYNPARAHGGDPAGVLWVEFYHTCSKEQRKTERRRRNERTVSANGVDGDGRADPIANALSSELDPERAAERAELMSLVSKAIDGLPDKPRRVFELRYFENKSVREIAKTLDMNPGAVLQALCRARRLLRERLGSLEKEWSHPGSGVGKEGPP